MHRAQLIRSGTFLWALAVAAAFALFVVALFAFIYWKLDDYLVARSDRMITTQIHFIADLPPARRISAIADHLDQDSRGVQYAGLFDAAGTRLPATSTTCRARSGSTARCRACGSICSRNRRFTVPSSGRSAGVSMAAMSW